MEWACAQKKKFSLMTLIAIFILFSLVAGCTKKDESLENGTLEVLYDGDEEWFQDKYGELFTAKYPNVDIKVISTRSLHTSGTYSRETFKKYIDENNPDVLVLNTTEYVWLNEENDLYDLTDSVYGQGFDSDQIHPSVLENLKIKGDGKLYGLAPTFYSTALFYNKDIFDSFGIPYPTDKMTWDEVMSLAQRFVDADKTVYGISQSFRNDPFNFAKNIADYKGVSLYDSKRELILLSSPEWNQIFELIVNAYKSGAVYEPKDEAEAREISQEEILRQQNVFLLGESAMTVDNYYLVNMIDKAAQPVNWDVVTLPIDSKNPNTTNAFFISDIFAIHQKTSNLKLSRKLIEFVNGDDFAKILGKSSVELISRTEYIKNNDNKNLEAFYELKPGDNMYRNYQELPQGLYSAISEIANRELYDVISDKKILSDALTTIQADSEIALEALKMKGE